MITLDELIKDYSIEIYDGMTVVWPQFDDEEEHLDIVSRLTPKFNHCCAMNNMVISFVWEYQVYVTPYTKEAMDILEKNDFKFKNFGVPFSNKEYPKAERVKWLKLCAKAKKLYNCNYSEK